MSRCRTHLSLAVIVLGVALVVACTGGRINQVTQAPTGTMAATAALPTPTGPAVAWATPSPLAEIFGIELVGYLGTDQAQAVFVQGDYAYVAFDIELGVVDVSDPSHPHRVGYTVLPDRVLDVAVAGSYAYVAAGSGGLHVVDVSDPTQPALLTTHYASSHVGGLVVEGSYAYVSTGTLRILDLSDPAAPVEIGAYRPSDLVGFLGKVAAVAGDYALALYHGGSSKVGGLRIVDVSDPAAPAEAGALATGGPVRGAAVSGAHAYLLVGQGMPHLAVVDISDPRNPTEVNLDPVTPWFAQSLAVVDGYAYLAYPAGADSGGYLQVLDVADPSHPVALGRYEGIAPPAADVALQGEQAYIAAGDGLHIVSVADPTGPKGSGRYRPDALPPTGRAVAVAGDPSAGQRREPVEGSGQVYAYVAAGEGGLLAVDVSDPVNPRVVSRHDTAGQSWDVALAGDYAYLADEYNGLRVIDVADPLHPVEVGFYDMPGLYEFFHGVAVAGDPSSGQRGEPVEPSGQVYAYVADGGFLGTGLRTVDVSDPTHPAEVSFLPVKIQIADDVPPVRAEGLAVANGYVYLAAGTGGLRVVDVSDPAAPIEVGFYDTPGLADNLVVADRHAYLADGDLRIVDVADPTAPALVGFYDLPGSAATPYVAVQDRYASVTDQGLQVLDVSDPGAPFAVAAHPIPAGNVAVSGDTVYVVGNGLFILRVLGPDKADAVPHAAPQTPPSKESGPCETHTAAMTLMATATTLKVGEVVTVTVALANEGCVDLGLPQYRLYVGSDEGQPIFDPERPEPIVHYLAVAPGQSDAAEFVLRAVEPGRATLSASASFEVHLGYPGPAYWGGSSADPLEMTVTR